MLDMITGFINSNVYHCRWHPVGYTLDWVIQSPQMVSYCSKYLERTPKSFWLTHIQNKLRNATNNQHLFSMTLKTCGDVQLFLHISNISVQINYLYENVNAAVAITFPSSCQLRNHIMLMGFNASVPILILFN